MGLDMYLSYRRNLDGIPETIQRAMRKQAYTDRYPYLAEHFDKEGKLDTIIDHHIERSEPYEEVLMHWHKARAINKFFVDNFDPDFVGNYIAIRVTIDTLKDLVERCEKILASGIDEDGELVDPQVAVELLPTQSRFFFNPNDYDSRYVDDLKETVKGLKPIVDHPELYPDLIGYRAWQ